MEVGVHNLKQLVWVTAIGAFMVATQANIAGAACGLYGYRHNGKCVDARGPGAGPPSFWHPSDTSSSIH